LPFYFQPFNATRINASAINHRVTELEKDNGTSNTKAGFWEEFEVRCLIDSVWCSLTLTFYSSNSNSRNAGIYTAEKKARNQKIVKRIVIKTYFLVSL
jgi:hypothetical protein